MSPRAPRGSGPRITPASQPRAARGHPARPREARAAAVSRSRRRSKQLPGWTLTCGPCAVLAEVFTRIPGNLERGRKAGCSASGRQMQKHCGWANRFLQGLCALREAGNCFNCELLLRYWGCAVTAAVPPWATVGEGTQDLFPEDSKKFELGNNDFRQNVLDAYFQLYFKPD